jgi:hypothetical protein
MKKCILKVNFFTIDVCWEPTIAHILGKQKGIIGALIQYTHWANTMLTSKTKNYNLTTIVSMGLIVGVVTMCSICYKGV